MFQPPVNEFQILIKSLGYFRTHWWLFALEVAAIYGISMHKFYKTPSVYESDAVLLIDSTRRQLYQSVILPGLTRNDNSRRQNMAHLLGGQELFERFKTQLTDFYNAENRPPHLRAFFPGGQPVSTAALRSNVILNWDRNSDIYNIRCNAENPNAAHDLCLNYLSTIQAYYPEVGQRESLMKRDFLSRQISSFLSQIKEREQLLADFQRRNQDFLNFVSMNIEERGLQRLRTERANLKHRTNSNRAIQKLLLSMPRARRGEHTSRTIAIAALTNKITQIQYQLQLTQNSNDPDRVSQISKLRTDYTDLTQQLARLNEDDVDAFLKNPINSTDLRKRLAELELEYKTDSIRLSAVEKEIEGLNVKEQMYNQQRLEYERLFTELNHKKRLLANLYQKEQEIELELSTGNAEVFRLQEPSRNAYRTSPQLSKHFYGGFSLSLFVLAITNVLLMALFPRLDSEADVNRLNLPVIGKIPLLKTRGLHIEELPGYGMEHLKIMNYRILRETKDTKAPVVVISSPHAREGKSTVANLLCLASQSTNRKSLLIDGDLLTSHPNKFFGISENASLGLKGLLEGTVEKPSDVIVKTQFDGLFFMPRGDRFDASAMANFAKPVERTLKELQKEFDVIYIDTPPLFASNLAHQWAGLGDLIVLVARIYATNPRDITEALQTCKVFSKAPVGVALNCMRFSAANRKASNYYFSRRKPVPTRIAA
jgi:Mrp family chromosome partitioning ATPase